MICSDPKSIVKKTQGSITGSCVSCADPSRKDTTDCKNKLEAIEIFSGSASTPTTVESLRLEPYEVAKKPVRVPNGGKFIIRLKFPEDQIQAITQLGNRFVFTDLIRVTINGLTSPTDYSFTGAVNNLDKSYEVTFNFARDHESLIVQFEVIQPNYFLLYLPPKTTRRRGRRQLQSFGTSTQQLMDAAKLVQSVTISSNLTAVNFNTNILEGLEDTGIHTRIFLYASVFLFAMGIMIVMMASKYDGLIIGRFFDYCFFIGFVVKIPYIRAKWTVYDLIFWDEIVRTDTLLMSSIIKEDKVRNRLQQKFIEYSIPANTVNNSTYYSAFFMLSLLAIGIITCLKPCLDQKKKGALVLKTLAAIILAVTLPSSFFYSGVSTMLYAKDDNVGAFVRFVYYMIGLVTFTSSLLFLIIFNFYGLIMEKLLTSLGKGYQKTLTQPPNGRETQLPAQDQRVDPKEWSTREKVSMEGISLDAHQPENNTNGQQGQRTQIKNFTANNLSMLRYALMLFFIIPLQKQSEALLIILIVVQLGMLLMSITFASWGEFESIKVAVLFLVYEVVFTAFIGSLGLTLAAKRDNNSTREYKRGTVPLIGLFMLMISVKILQILMSAWSEWRRTTSKQKQNMVRGSR